jgi:hypothetical protein
MSKDEFLNRLNTTWSWYKMHNSGTYQWAERDMSDRPSNPLSHYGSGTIIAQPSPNGYMLYDSIQNAGAYLNHCLPGSFVVGTHNGGQYEIKYRPIEGERL